MSQLEDFGSSELSWEWWYTSIVPTTQEAEPGELFETMSLRSAWAMSGDPTKEERKEGRQKEN